MGSGHTDTHQGATPPTAASPTIERNLRVAVVVCAVLTLIGLVALWPSGDASGRGGIDDPAVLDADPVDARVRSVEIAPCTYDASTDCLIATISVTSGVTSGDVFTIEQLADTTGRRLTAGDDVLVLAAQNIDGTTSYSFYEYERSTPMLLLVLLFVVAIVLLGRWRGVGALAGLVASLLVLVVFMLPSLLDGNNAVLTALVAASVIAFIALYLAHGVSTATTVALLSTFAALAITGVLSWIFVRAANFTGFTDDSSQFLDALNVPIDARGILLAGIVIGSLGVLDDVTVTQVSAVWELHSARPELTGPELYSSALRIGRDHISSTVNTLFLAYAGASLPLLLLFTEAGQGIGSIATREVVAVEIVRSLVGSIGLVSAVPISTWLAARVLHPSAPTIDPPANRGDVVIALTDELRAGMVGHLGTHSVRTIAPDDRKRAAVAIVVVDSEAATDLDDPYEVTSDEMSIVPGDITGLDGSMRGVAGGAAFLLCRRASRMNRHAAQWALPGGRVDPGETIEQTALRELDEELGVLLPPESVLGRLDDYATRSGYVISPVVVWGGAGLQLRPNPDEVAHVYRIGLHELCRPDSPRFVDIPESDRPVVQVPLGGDLIHAPTGAVLVQFRWVALDGRIDERVDEFEQPVFAWG